MTDVESQGTLGNFFSRLGRVALAGRRGAKIALQAQQEASAFEARERRLSALARSEGIEDLLVILRNKRDAAKAERREVIRDHIALAAAMRAEDCFQEVIDLLERYKSFVPTKAQTGEPEAESLSRWTVGEGS